MSETRDYKVIIRFVRGYEFVATFPDGEGLPPIVFDEPPPLGEGSGPNAAAVLLRRSATVWPPASRSA